MPRPCFIGLFIVLSLASALWARPGIVHTKDGRSIEGDVTEKSDAVEISMRGVTLRMARDQVESVEYPEGVDEEFKRKLARLEPADADGRLALARWAFDNRRYDLARDATDQALEIDPNNRAATEFLNTIRRQVQVERKVPPPAAAAPAQPAPGTMPADDNDDDDADGAPASELGKLSPEQIDVIRQKELRSTDNVTVRFENNVKRRYVDAVRMESAEFNRMRPAEQAVVILRNRPQFAKDVKILRDPSSVQQFRLKVQPMLLAGCATSGCHGGTDAGDFQFHRTANDDASTYTNFYVLQTYAKALPRSLHGKPMIDRVNPERSLLVQYALPSDDADDPHPAVQGYFGLVRSASDRRYQILVEWIDSMRGVQPFYDIDFRLPWTSGGTTQPERDGAP